MITDERLLMDLSQKERISIDMLIHEQYEMFVLNHLWQSSFGSHLIFMGGTALRLCYQSPRYSEDLDFIQLQSIQKKTFEKTVLLLEKQLPSVKVADVYDKFNTLFVLLKIELSYLKNPLSLKIEISKRKTSLIKGKDYQVMMAKSPHFPSSAYGFCLTMNGLWREKMKAWRKRTYPRDFFDLWFIKTKAGLQQKLPVVTLPKSVVNRDMHRLLPVKDWRLLSAIF